MDVALYLKRIGYFGSVKPDLETLRNLHAAHSLSVPFENLDIHRGISIVLEKEPLYRKIVLKRRGGYCYELNLLFYFLLREIGFDVEIYRGCLFSDDETLIPPSVHLLLGVKIQERWIADVGVGNGGYLFPEPLDSVHQQSGYRFFPRENGYVLQDPICNGLWRNHYFFVPKPETSLTVFEERNRYHQTSHESVMKRKRICSKPTLFGSVDLIDRVLTVSENGHTAKRELSKDSDYVLALEKYFGIRLDP